jgi:hypothetical protein
MLFVVWDISESKSSRGSADCARAMLGGNLAP